VSQEPLSAAARAAIDAGLKSTINDLSRETDVLCFRIPFRDQRPWLIAILFSVIAPPMALIYELTR
jgi:hypothetical protein